MLARSRGFSIFPVDELTAMPLQAKYFLGKQLKNPVVVSPDLGNTKRARNFAEFLDARLAVIEKRRMGNADRSEVLNLIGSVVDSDVVIIDDEIDTAGFDHPGGSCLPREWCLAGLRDLYPRGFVGPSAGTS